MGGWIKLTKIGTKGVQLTEFCFLVAFHIYVFICHQWNIFVIFFSGTMEARQFKLGINMDHGWLYRGNRNRGQVPITPGVMFLSRFSHLRFNLSSMKTFRNTFLGNYESRKPKLGINMDNGWLYLAYRNSGQGPITLGVIFLSRFWHLFIYLSSKKKFS